MGRCHQTKVHRGTGNDSWCIGSKIRYSLIDREQLEKISYLCKNDMASYFNRRNKDDLDRALYAKSEEYKKDKIEFDKKRKRQIAFVMSLGSVRIDFTSRGFSCFRQISSNCPEAAAPYYLDVGNILFPIKKMKNVNCPEFNTLSLEALKEMQDEKENIALLMIFKPNNAFSFLRSFFEKYETEAVVSPIGLYVVNLKTKKIIADLRSYMRNTAPAVEKKMIAQFNAKTFAGFPKYHKVPQKLRCHTCFGLGFYRNSEGNKIPCLNCRGQGYVLNYKY